MTTALARTTGSILALSVLLACMLGAFGVLAPERGAEHGPSLGMMATILWLLGAGGAVCLLLRRVIDADDCARELGTRLAREGTARQHLESMLAETQSVLARVVRQQESTRDGERGRIAREIEDELGQMLLSLRIELSLLQVSSNGIHPAVYQKSTAMIVTLDLALRSLRAVVSELRPLPAGESLDVALARLLADFTQHSGIVHHFEAAPVATDAAAAGGEVDALLYRVLQEALADVARQASATEVHVCLGRDGERLSLRLDDNGSAAPDGASTACGCGVQSMRDRIEALGGQLRMSNTSGARNALTLSLPVPRVLVLG